MSLGVKIIIISIFRINYYILYSILAQNYRLERMNQNIVLLL